MYIIVMQTATNKRRFVIAFFFFDRSSWVELTLKMMPSALYKCGCLVFVIYDRYDRWCKKECKCDDKLFTTKSPQKTKTKIINRTAFIKAFIVIDYNIKKIAREEIKGTCRLLSWCVLIVLKLISHAKVQLRLQHKVHSHFFPSDFHLIFRPSFCLLFLCPSTFTSPALGCGFSLAIFSIVLILNGANHLLPLVLFSVVASVSPDLAPLRI